MKLATVPYALRRPLSFVSSMCDKAAVCLCLVLLLFGRLHSFYSLIHFIYLRIYLRMCLLLYICQYLFL